MRRILSLCLLIVLLTGCGGEDSLLAQGIAFRSELISRGGCSFHAQITVDYGQEIQCFAVECESDGDGEVTFCVKEPDTIEGITGKMDGQEGTVTYDGLQLAFPLLANDRISPVSAPALMVECWLREYILSAGETEGICRVSYEKKINEKDLLIDTYFENHIPISAELCYNGYRIVNIKITDFTFH